MAMARAMPMANVISMARAMAMVGSTAMVNQLLACGKLRQTFGGCRFHHGFPLLLLFLLCVIRSVRWFQYK